MDVDKISVFTAVGFALAVGVFVLWGPSPRPRRKGQVVGIKNLEYTCFLNSLLQSLAACPVFIEWLFKRHDDKKPESFTNNLMMVIDKINGFTDDAFGSVRPIEVITSLGPLWNFAPGHQDAHELFHVFLSALQAELQTSCRKGCLSDALPKTPMVITDIKGSGDPVNLRSVSCNDIVSVNEKRDFPNEKNKQNKNLPSHIVSYAQSIANVSATVPAVKPGIIIARSSELLSKIIGDHGAEGDSLRPWSSLCTIPLQSSTSTLSNKVHPFSGLLTSQLICTECKWKGSVHFEKLESVSLPLPPANDGLIWKRLTLIGLLSRLVSREVIHDVQCDGCNNRCAAFKTLTFGKLPKCLCLHIPRTTWSPSGMPIKRDDSVIFNECLILDPFTYTETNRKNSQGNIHTMPILSRQSLQHVKHKYYLYAVIEHQGPVDAGHFVCYRRGNRPGQWLYTSDTIVQKVALEDVLNANDKNQRIVINFLRC
ncbi:PREDICTED: ubiquitin carboxyl-terminal hydrolase 30 [Ceratosolen solmsi marchali]|uniref:ubiquitinyl hydrolase 1 n=1 Tax=Ceratosolen solmsi marchali TaxID=326594 RepID=A0AAJ6VK59_9HYME|nr:PREDICTED: ubiquitin carboxyl-terminal hydrolase 30 [Ceratosolen solmsi marchali]